MRLSQGVYLAAMARLQGAWLQEPRFCYLSGGASGKEDQSVIPELAVFSLDGSDGMAHKAEIQETSY